MKKVLLFLNLFVVMTLVLMACSQITDSRNIEPNLPEIPVEEYVIEWEDSSEYTENYYSKEYDGSEYDRPVDADTEISLNGKYSNSLPVINNSEPLKNMASLVDDETIINSIWYTLPYQPSYLNATETSTLQEILTNTLREGGVSRENALPVNFLRQMECGDFFYTVMKFNKGYAYAIFGRPMTGCTENGEPIYSTEDITELKFYGGVYATKSVKYKDFKKITIGSSILDIIEIEPAAENVLQLHRSYRSIGVPFFRDMHQVLLLEDGLLEIIYEPREKTEVDYYGQKYLSNETDDLIVKSITYFPDFMYKSTLNAQLAETDNIPSIPIQILEKDYPPVN